MSVAKRLFFSAGEASGDHHAAQLVLALRRSLPDLEVDAFGGEELEAAGARVLYPLPKHAAMGFSHVFKGLGHWLGIISRFDAYLRDSRPDAVVLLDFPGLHLRFAVLAKRRGIPVTYYICPQLWAWAPWRARKFARRVDHALTILPFEEEYFGRRGIDARYVGHPAVDRLSEATSTPEEEALTAEVRAAKPGLALLPGSRPAEARANLGLARDVIRRVREEEPDARWFLPMERADTRKLCEEILAADPIPGVTIVDSLLPVLRGAHFALVASGTVTFEVAFHEVPMVVVYRIKPIHQFLGRHMLTIPWVSQVNLIAGEELVPEFITAEPDSEVIAARCLELIRDTPARRRQEEGMARTFREAFQPGAADRAAREILDHLGAVNEQNTGK